MATEQMPAIIRGYTPKVIDKYLDQTQDGYAGVVRYHQRGWAGVRAVFVHVQEGSNWGSWQWFHQVKASATAMIAKNGDIWNTVQEWYAPWTNGDVNLPSQFVIAMMNRYGWDPNTWGKTIENEGFSGHLPYTPEQLKSNVWQIWQWKHKDPTIEAVLGHYTVNSVDRAYCPDPEPHPFMKQINDALSGAMVPVEKPTEIYRPAWPVVSDTGVAWDGKTDLTTTNEKGVKTVWHAEKRSVTVSVDGLNCRQWASQTANLVRESLPKGTKVDVLGWVEGEEVDGERRWWVSTFGTRLWAGGTTEKPKAAALKPTTPSDGVSKPDYGNNRDEIPVLLNGNTYYPVPRRGDSKSVEMRFTVAGNVRLWAATHQWSPVKRVQSAGSTVNVLYWVKGESVDGNDKWFVIDEGKDPIRTGGRIWSGLVEPV